MNERVAVEFTVTGLGFRREEETYTARVEITWGIQAQPYVYETTVVGTNDLTEEQLEDTETYPYTVLAPGFSFTGTALCQFNIGIWASSHTYSGSVTVRIVDEAAPLYEWRDGAWGGEEFTEEVGGSWNMPIGDMLANPTSNFDGVDTYSNSFPLFAGDPTDDCGATTDPTEPPTGGGGVDEPAETPVPSTPTEGGNMAVVTLTPTASTEEAYLPGCVTLTEWECETATSDTGCDTDCNNPFYAVAHQDTCDTLTVASIRVVPSSIRIPKDRRSLFRVVAVFSDGRQGDVTSSATIQVQDTDYAEMVTRGVLRGVDAGPTLLQVAWSGQTAEAPIEVFESECDDAYDESGENGWDVVIVLDQSIASFWFSGRPYAPGCGIYWRPTPGSEGYIAEYGSMVLATMLSLSLKNPWDDDAGDDRVAIVVTGDGDPTVFATWTDTMPSVSGVCVAYPDAHIGEALDVAHTLFDSGRSAANKLVVLISCGSEASCTQTARSVASELETDSIPLAVVTPLNASMPWTVFSPCTYPETALDYLESIASSCLFFPDNGGLDCLAQFPEIVSAKCGCPESY